MPNEAQNHVLAGPGRSAGCKKPLCFRARWPPAVFFPKKTPPQKLDMPAWPKLVEFWSNIDEKLTKMFRGRNVCGNFGLGPKNKAKMGPRRGLHLSTREWDGGTNSGSQGGRQQEEGRDLPRLFWCYSSGDAVYVSGVGCGTHSENGNYLIRITRKLVKPFVLLLQPWSWSQITQRTKN